MQVVDFSYSNLMPLTGRYSLDNDLKTKENVFYTENNVGLPLSNMFNKANDFKTNNFSNLYLTEKKLLSDATFIKPLEYLPDEGFSTYLAVNALNNTIVSTTKFLVVEEPPFNINVANLSISGSFLNIDNRYFVEVELLNDKLCKVAHENSGIKRYLTYSTTGNIVFAKDAALDFLGEYSPQIFGYIYDRDNDFIVFYKNVSDIVNYVTFNPELNNLQLVQALSGSGITFKNNSIFKCVKRGDAANSTSLTNSWVSYNKNLDNNRLEINEDRSYESLEENFLVNSEYFNISSNELNYNILALKNTNTPENDQARCNPFLDKQEIINRDYKQLFTGSNQELGNDNVTLEYDAYTSKILLKKDKITYFHVPEIFYPFEKLNINDSKIQEAGAIAGDHPLRSDKIFKKKSDYKFTSYFGETLDETTGDFLCAWLSGNTNPNSKPIWVDRYYDPKKISYVGALSTLGFDIITYKTSFECLIDTVNDIYGYVPVFDKPSDLIFEPGTYFAYHHIGSEYCKSFIRSLSSKIVQNGLTNYFFSDGGDATYTLNLENPEYVFNGNTYSISNNLSSLQTFSQFTLIFDMYNNDWKKPFGYQILGNYSSDGIGLFNINYLTPALFLKKNNNFIVTNLDLNYLNTVEFDANPKAIMRTEGLNDYYVVCDDNTFRKLDNKNVEIYATSPGVDNDFAKFRGSDYDEEYAYILTEGKVFKANLESGNISDISLGDDVPFVYGPGTGSTIVGSSAINLYDGKLFFTPSSISKRIDDDIYYLKNNLIYKWSDIDRTSKVDTVFSSSGVINNFNIDIDKNIWILYMDNRYAKFDSNLVFQASGILTNPSSKNLRIDFSNVIEEGEVVQYAYVTTLSGGLSNRLEVYKINTQGKILSSFSSQISQINNAADIKFYPLTQSDYLREYVKPKYPGSSINLKVKLSNVFNERNKELVNLVYNLSSLSPGYHNFAVRFDSYGGTAYLIIDGQIVSFKEFKPRKYQFSDIAKRPFIIGAAPYTGTTPLFEYLNDNSFNVYNCKLKNFYLYNAPLNYFDICFHTRESDNIEDIEFNLPCGHKSLLEEVERYFKFRSPGNKSTVMNIVLKNSGISKKDLQEEVEKRILNLLNKTVPAYVKLGSIKWKN